MNEIIKRIDRPTILAIMATSAFIGVVFTLLLKEMPKEGREVLLTMLGALGMLVKDVYSFDFGSSKGSEKKDDAMLAAAAKAQDAPSPAPPTPSPPADSVPLTPPLVAAMP